MSRRREICKLLFPTFYIFVYGEFYNITRDINSSNIQKPISSLCSQMIGSLENITGSSAMLATVFGVYKHQEVLSTHFNQKPQCHTALCPQLLMEEKHKSGLWEVILMTWLAWVEMAAVWMGRVHSSFNLYLFSSSSTSMSLV